MKSKIVAISFICLLAAGCGSLSPFSSGPGSILKSFVMTAIAGKYSELNEFLSADAKKALEGPVGAFGGGLKNLVDEYTKNGTVERIEIVKEEIRGESAKITANLCYKDGTVKRNDETNLIKENGRWKITL